MSNFTSLPNVVAALHADLKRERSIKADLLDALKTMLDAFYEDPMDNDHSGAAEKAYAAIAKATGEQP